MFTKSGYTWCQLVCLCGGGRTGVCMCMCVMCDIMMVQRDYTNLTVVHL